MSYLMVNKKIYVTTPNDTVLASKMIDKINAINLNELEWEELEEFEE